MGLGGGHLNIFFDNYVRLCYNKGVPKEQKRKKKRGNIMTNTSTSRRRKQEQVKELSNSIIQMLEGMGFVFSVPNEKVEEISTNYLDKKKG